MCNKPCWKDVAYPNHVNCIIRRHLMMIYIKYVMRLTIEPSCVFLFTRFHHRKCKLKVIKEKLSENFFLFFFFPRIVLDLIKGLVAAVVTISYL